MHLPREWSEDTLGTSEMNSQLLKGAIVEEYSRPVKCTEIIFESFNKKKKNIKQKQEIRWHVFRSFKKTKL